MLNKEITKEVYAKFDEKTNNVFKDFRDSILNEKITYSKTESGLEIWFDENEKPVAVKKSYKDEDGNDCWKKLVMPKPYTDMIIKSSDGTVELYHLDEKDKILYEITRDGEVELVNLNDLVNY